MPLPCSSTLPLVFSAPPLLLCFCSRFSAPQRRATFLDALTRGRSFGVSVQRYDDKDQWGVVGPRLRSLCSPGAVAQARAFYKTRCDASPLEPDASVLDPDPSPLEPDDSPLEPDASPLDPDVSPLDPDAEPWPPLTPCLPHFCLCVSWLF